MSLSRDSHSITLIGHLGRDPETRFTPSGQEVCNFSVATTRKWNTAEGVPGEETIWWRCSAWGKTAQVCQKYLAKGRQVLIEGRLVVDSNTNAPRIYTRTTDGSPAVSLEVNIENLKFLGARGDAPATPAPYGDPAAPGTGVEEEPVPF